jgi:hypothetical protein
MYGMVPNLPFCFFGGDLNTPAYSKGFPTSIYSSSESGEVDVAALFTVLSPNLLKTDELP